MFLILCFIVDVQHLDNIYSSSCKDANMWVQTRIMSEIPGSAYAYSCQRRQCAAAADDADADTADDAADYAADAAAMTTRLTTFLCWLGWPSLIYSDNVYMMRGDAVSLVTCPSLAPVEEAKSSKL